MVTAYENTSSNYYKTTTEVTCKGDKSFCIYCDNNASENETKVIKQLPPKSMTCVIILKYSNSSIFSCSSTIQASTEKEAKAKIILILILIIIYRKLIIIIIIMYILCLIWKENLLMMMDI